MHYNDGDRYEGDWRNNKREGKGIYYYNNGNREIGDYLDNKEIGTHVVLKANSKVSSKNIKNYFKSNLIKLIDNKLD